MNSKHDPHQAQATATPAEHHCACSADQLHEDLHKAGARFLENTKGLRAEVVKQMQQHPVATFGVAFAAGLVLARALRR